MKIFIGILSSFLMINCTTQRQISQLKNGDMIFVQAKNENLSGAISRVTKTDENAISYDHAALIEITPREKNILHASGENGSEKLPLKKFIQKNQKEKRIMGVYRVKKKFAHCTENAVKKAHSLLGKPYNFLYIPTDEALYCSDFLERAYRDCKIFELKPMTFINPETGKTDEFWQKLYDSKNAKVPEGELGCNPNGISKSEKIEFLFYIK